MADTMYRFAIKDDVELATNARQLAEAGITEDESFAETLRDTEAYAGDERYFRVENRTPASVAEAAEYVQGVLFHPPRRVWIDGEIYPVEADDLAAAEKPGA